ncbi:Fe-S cluster assembly protein SufD [Cellvibrio zantedeschiae]|uniref:Fe-S cluster assembly protein SufD n=1 Tax=Cellvibrio zantedeschiae TaxID=1237077 RepID=A0ABQ3ATN4_9GAMM|nr:Fe-S cluster assembly protein SufD [Cellvibrio zantedeschiae]GGY66927.1 Fe-S cluster assembly protein SufD [Cellvibrio zantedeschiae]
MSDFQQQALKLAAQQQSPTWLGDLRAQAANDWFNVKWPTRKTEHWKYTSLASLQKNIPNTWATTSVSADLALEFIAVDAIRLVFVNGVFDQASSTALQAEVVRFSQANDAQQKLIVLHLGKVVEGPQHLFATLNNAWVDDGILVHVARNQTITKPIYIVQVSTPEAQAVSVNQRVLVVLEDSAQAEVIEHYISTSEAQNSFVNSLTEIVVGDNAQLQHYRLNLEEENIQHIGAVHVNLLRNARLRGFTLAMGSKLKRIDYQINHRGQGAELNLQGVYLPRNNQMVDYHSNVQHWVPHCTTSEVFRGIIADSAQAVFNGRIYIHKDAQKTLAELSNKNLLTSNKAEINTKPELEIYADDVKCAHGATVSQLNATALYYLQSRGVSRTEAEVMMSFGFINELLEQIPEVAVHDYLFPRLAALFGRDQALFTVADE